MEKLDLKTAYELNEKIEWLKRKRKIVEKILQESKNKEHYFNKLRICFDTDNRIELDNDLISYPEIFHNYLYKLDEKIAEMEHKLEDILNN